MRAVDADEESYTDKGWNLGIGAAIDLIQAAMTLDTSIY